MKYLIFVFLALLTVSFVFYEDEGLTPYAFIKQPGFSKMPVNEENLVTEEGAALGRFLFYDPILSRDSSISCASCHQQQYAFSDGGKRFSVGIDGQQTVRNTPPLFNLAWYPAMFWDGRAASIEEQVFFPVRDHAEMDLNWIEVEKRINRSPFYAPKFREMYGTAQIDSAQIAFVIAQFERTLISANSKLDRAVRGEVKFNADELRGFEVMNDQSMGDCLHCHLTDGITLGSSFKFSNNGIDAPIHLNGYDDLGQGAITGDSTKNGWFKIPTVRNVMITAPYMHDGRFKNIDEVLDFYSEGVQRPKNVDSKMTTSKEGGAYLSDEDKEAVKAFLHALTDSSFIKNPAFSNPWE